MSKRIVPYYNIYAADFKAFKDKLTPQEFFEILDAMSDLCLFNFTDYKPKNNYQKIYFKKLQENLQKNIKSYNASVENGRLGGRPRNKINKPIGYPKQNLDETKRKENKTKEKIKKEKDKKKKIEKMFEEVYKKYPKKIGKQKSKIKFISIFENLTEEETLVLKDEIINGIKKYNEWIFRKEIQDKYIKYLSTYIDNESWKDEL